MCDNECNCATAFYVPGVILGRNAFAQKYFVECENAIMLNILFAGRFKNNGILLSHPPFSPLLPLHIYLCQHVRYKIIHANIYLFIIRDLLFDYKIICRLRSRLFFISLSIDRSFACIKRSFRSFCGANFNCDSPFHFRDRENVTNRDGERRIEPRFPNRSGFVILTNGRMCEDISQKSLAHYAHARFSRGLRGRMDAGNSWKMFFARQRC